MAAAARAGKQAKPKGTTSGEFYTSKDWFATAKSGMTNDLSAGKTIKYGYAPNAGWFTTVHAITGVPLYQSATSNVTTPGLPSLNNKVTSILLNEPSLMAKMAILE